MSFFYKITDYESIGKEWGQKAKAFVDAVNALQKPQKLDRDELVQSVLAHFDFDKVQKVMHALNWKWVSSKTSDYIPTISETVLLAKKHLEMAYDELLKSNEERFFISSSGFKAIATRYEDGEIVLELDFVVTEFNWSSQDTCY